MPSRSVAVREAEQSLRVYAWYLPLSRIYFFTPVYFLFFLERFTLEEVLLLGSVYYVAVVGFELPSGYLSDRVGRLFALRLSAATMSAAYALFLLGGDRFAWFVMAQVLLGIGFASISGTDTAYHYDALHAAGRAGEFGAREERLTRNGYWASAAGAVLAGAVAQVDLAWAYALCLANALGLLALSLALGEPERDADGFASGRLVEQARAIGRALRAPPLAWLFAFGVVSVSLAHLPAEFAQPYLAAVLGEDVREWGGRRSRRVGSWVSTRGSPVWPRARASGCGRGSGSTGRCWASWHGRWSCSPPWRRWCTRWSPWGS
jgi:MFS family permease